MSDEVVSQGGAFERENRVFTEPSDCCEGPFQYSKGAYEFSRTEVASANES